MIAKTWIATLATLALVSTADAEPRRIAGPPEERRLVWRTEDAMRKGNALWSSRADPAITRLIMTYVACLPQGQTPVAVTQGGRHVSALIVTAGPFQGCEGVILNGDLAPRR